MEQRERKGPATITKGGLAHDVTMDLAARRGLQAAKEAVRTAIGDGTASVVPTESGPALVLRRVMSRHAHLLQSIQDRRSQPKPPADGAALLTTCLASGFAPDTAQSGALATIVGSAVSIIHGGPGCGKTSIARIAASHLQETEPGREQVVVAFSAKVALETARKCGLRGMTMHAFAGLRPGEEESASILNRDTVGTLYVDEAFSAQPALLHAMFRCTPPTCRIVFLGDPMQLAPIGDGRALHDILASGLVPSAMLATSHRLGANSHLAKQAARIAAGHPPLAGPNLSIATSGSAPAPQAAWERAAYACALHRDAIRRNRSSIILTPTQYGVTGHVAINQAVTHGRTGIGDPVIAVATDREGRWRNGQRGIVTGRFGGFLTIQMETGTTLSVDPRDKAFLVAHAMSAHRAQGLEYDEAILVLTRENERTATRQMIVSAMTRARRCTIVTEPGVLERIVSRDQMAARPKTLEAALARRPDIQRRDRHGQ